MCNEARVKKLFFSQQETNRGRGRGFEGSREFASSRGRFFQAGSSNYARRDERGRGKLRCSELKRLNSLSLSFSSAFSSWFSGCSTTSFCVVGNERHWSCVTHIKSTTEIYSWVTKVLCSWKVTFIFLDMEMFNSVSHIVFVFQT